MTSGDNENVIGFRYGRSLKTRFALRYLTGRRICDDAHPVWMTVLADENENQQAGLCNPNGLRN